MKSFGAFLTDEIAIPFIKGLTFGELHSSEVPAEFEGKTQLGVLRTPKKQQIKAKKQTRWQKVKNFFSNLWRQLWKEDGLLTNFFVAMFHFATIIMIPIPSILIIAQFLFERDSDKHDIFYKVFTIGDIVNPNSSNFWLSGVEVSILLMILAE